MLRGGSLVLPLFGLNLCFVGGFQSFILSWSMLDFFFLSVDGCIFFRGIEQMLQLPLVQSSKALSLRN